MAKNYLYKIKYNFKRNPDKLLNYGFSKYEDELGEETLYAMPIVLPDNGSIFEYLKRSLEKIYTYATSEERLNDFTGYCFVEILTEKQQRDYKLVVTDEIKKDFTEAQLCFYDSGEGAWCLFINAPDHVQYYNAITLEESCGDIIAKLVEEKLIYKVRNRIRSKKK